MCVYRYLQTRNDKSTKHSTWAGQKGPEPSHKIAGIFIKHHTIVWVL